MKTASLAVVFLASCFAVTGGRRYISVTRVFCDGNTVMSLCTIKEPVDDAPVYNVGYIYDNKGDAWSLGSDFGTVTFHVIASTIGEDDLCTAANSSNVANSNWIKRFVVKNLLIYLLFLATSVMYSSQILVQKQLKYT